MAQTLWLNIRGLRIDQVRLGAYAHERESTTRVRIDLRLRLTRSVGAGADTLSATVDYTQVRACLEAVARRQHYVLVETLAVQAAKVLLTAFTRVRAVHLRVHKPSGLRGAMPSIEVMRTR